MGYTKLFNELIASTIWAEPDPTRILWITLLALRNRNHVIEASMPGLAHYARITQEECQAGLKTLLSPDPHSRSKEAEGRRIMEVEGGYFIINGEKYREKMSLEERREYQATWKRKDRAKKKAERELVDDTVDTLTDISTELTQTETETETGIYRDPSGSLAQIKKDFNLFWVHWPKKLQKALAIKAWNKLTSDEQNLAIADIRTRPEKDKGWADKQFIPYPATYLNGKRWQDQYDEVTHEPTFDELLAQNLAEGHSDPVQHDEAPLSLVHEQSD